MIQEFFKNRLNINDHQTTFACYLALHMVNDLLLLKIFHFHLETSLLLVDSFHEFLNKFNIAFFDPIEFWMHLHSLSSKWMERTQINVCFDSLDVVLYFIKICSFANYFTLIMKKLRNKNICNLVKRIGICFSFSKKYWITNMSKI